jgi:RNA polymerase sigma factor (sigma-70 family)
MSAAPQVPEPRSRPPYPAELAQLLCATDENERQAAWSGLVESYSRLLLHFARGLGGDHDAAMDRYAFMLDRLSQDDFRRLRAYRSDNRAAFSTWLSTVARRLCIDHYRERCGRTRAGVSRQASERMARRRELARPQQSNSPRDFAELPDPNAVDPVIEMCVAELRVALSRAVEDLEPADRELLAYWFDQEMSAAEVAQRLGYESPLQVYRRVHRACGRLRRRLEAQGIREALP